MLAIIGGSSLASLSILDITHRQVVRTPYGDPSCALTFGLIGGQNVVFIARHGYGNSIPPHEINYRANIWALHSVGVRGIVAIGSAGGIRPDLAPGSLVVPDDLIDYTWERKHTFFEGSGPALTHANFTSPYDETLRTRLINAASAVGLPLFAGGVYACSQGPRLETVAEILRLERAGADLVGMTGMPEAALAREMNLPYASLCIVTNWAASRNARKMQENFSADILARCNEQLHTLLLQAI